MRTRRTVLAIVAIAALVAGCSGSAATPTSVASTEAVLTTSPAFGSAAATTAPELSGAITILEKYTDTKIASFWKAVVDGYEALHPKVTITYEAVGDQPIKDKLRILAAANQLPDIYFSWAGDYTAKFVRAGLAADLTPYLSGTDWGKSFIPATLAAYSVDGKNYGVPFTFDAKEMFYNKTIFSKYGLSIPKTLDDLLTLCDTLKSKGVTPISFGNVYEWPGIHYMTQLNQYFVPSSVITTDYDPLTGSFTDPGYITALQWLQKLNNRCFAKGGNGTTFDISSALFAGGKAGMMYDETVDFAAYTAAGGAPAGFDSQWGFFQLPSEPGAAGNANVIEGAPDGFLINKSTKHMDIAIDFLKYLTNLDNAEKLITTAGYQSPVIGSTTSDNSIPQAVELMSTLSDSKNMAIWLDTELQTDVATAYLDGVAAVIGGSKTPEQVMASIQAASAKAKAALQSGASATP